MSRGLSPVSTCGTCSGDSQKDLEGTPMGELLGDILRDSHFQGGNLLWRVVRSFWAQNSRGAFSRISLKQYPVKFNHVTVFSPTGLGIFTFILLRNSPSFPLLRDKVISERWQFFCWGYSQNLLAWELLEPCLMILHNTAVLHWATQLQFNQQKASFCSCFFWDHCRVAP